MILLGMSLLPLLPPLHLAFFPYLFTLLLSTYFVPTIVVVRSHTMIKNNTPCPHGAFKFSEGERCQLVLSTNSSRVPPMCLALQQDEKGCEALL